LNLDPSIKLKYAIGHKEFIKYLTKVDFITCVSRLLKEKTIEVLPEVKNKCIYISNALNRADFKNTSNLKNDKDTKVQLLFMGGDKEVKGGILLIKAIENLINNFNITNFKLTILGPMNKEGDFYKMLISNKVIENYIEVIGFIQPPNHLQYIENSDVIIMPSKSEGVPIVLSEAMKLESALVVSNIPAFNDLLVDKQSALIFNLNEDALEESLKEIIVDTNLRNNIIQNNKKEKISYWDEIVKEYEKIYLIDSEINND
jgi:glycosyltransferase involved in cell wall biosynthesis